jgi:hypothetical protein
MLLLRQALALQMSPTPSTGISIIIENRNLLGIPLEVPVPQPSPIRNRAGLQVRESSALEGQSRDITGSMNSHTRNSSSQLPLGLPEAIARGFLDKGESLGINKAFMSAVSDLKVSFFSLAFNSCSKMKHFIRKTYQSWRRLWFGRPLQDLPLVLLSLLPMTALWNDLRRKDALGLN